MGEPCIFLFARSGFFSYHGLHSTKNKAIDGARYIGILCVRGGYIAGDILYICGSSRLIEISAMKHSSCFSSFLSVNPFLAFSDEPKQYLQFFRGFPVVWERPYSSDQI